MLCCDLRWIFFLSSHAAFFFVINGCHMVLQHFQELLRKYMDSLQNEWGAIFLSLFGSLQYLF
jgi:hypothetical protein